MRRKFLAMALSIAMVLTLLPMTALAADGEIDINEINFPDANFRGWLQSQAYGMDNILTTLEIGSIIKMDVSSKSISDLTGIGYFMALAELNCDNNNLKTLPDLPDGLIILNCDNNNLMTLPDLPSGLKSLLCNNNNLMVLPDLPDGLVAFYCDNNSLTALPLLPNSIRGFYCNSNSLKTLPNLPDGLVLFSCDNNKLTTLPSLPDSLTGFTCEFNSLTSLPDLPNALEGLGCSNNSLTALPVLPESLTRLSCSNNSLTTLALNSSASYTDIDVSNNFMTAASAVTGKTIDWRSEDDTSGDVNFIFYPQKTSPAGTDITSDFPDLNFLAAVRTALGKVVSDPIYDTDNFASVTLLDVSDMSITSLAGLEHFTALTELDCSQNNLTTLPALPDGLKKLNCSDNILTELPALPYSLTWLYCGDNDLATLPALPSSLIQLSCSSNNLTTLPTLPASLQILLCSSNNLTGLPTLPTGLIRLSCAFNSLQALPTLPTGLTRFYCNNNNITSLLMLPNSLKELYCANNSLTTLPHLPDTLEELDCDYNNLTELPTLPNSLTWLSCNDNRLTALTLNSNASYDHIDVSNNFMTATSAVTGQTIDWRSEDDTSGDVRFAFYPQSTPSSIAPTITSANVTAFTVGMAGSFTVAASNSPASFAVSGDTLPTGIAFDTATGVLSGTPAAGMAGTYNLSFTATNGSGTSPAQSFTLTVNPVGATTYTVTINGSYAGTNGAGSYAQGDTVTIAAGSRSNYSFTGWTASGVTLASPGSASTTFTMPSGTVTVIANWTKNSSGGGSSGETNTTPSTNVTTDKQPDMPTVVKMSVSGTLKDGILSATITEQMVKDAIKMTQDVAKKSSKEADGIAVELNVIGSGNYTSLNAALDAGIIDRLKEAGVKSVKIGSAVLDITLDTGAIAEIDKQSIGTVTVSARKLTKLSDAAKALIGSRPVFDITVSYQKNGKPEYVSNFGKGVVALGIAYKVADNENKGNLFGVYVDRNGKPHLLANSSYDNTGRLIFNRNSLSTYGVGYKAPSPAFTDTAKHWAKNNINFVVSRELISGTSATTFAPNKAITRADFLMALGRLSGADMSNCKATSFTDVKDTDAAMPYIEWAVKNKIVQGIGGGKFGPNEQISRQDMAVMMVNYATATGYKLPMSRQSITFADDTTISAYAKDAVKAIQQTGIINGKDNNRFDPQGNATRAEASTILRRFVELVIDEDTARGWVQNDAGQWQYIGINGKPSIGWLTAEGGKYHYYFTADGSMTAGKWLEIEGKWYYFNADGSLAKSTKIDGYEVDENGVRLAN